MYSNTTTLQPAGYGGDLLGAAVGAIVNAGTEIYNSSQDRKAAKQNLAAQMAHESELAQYSYNKDLEMWGLQNSYNSPLSQMSRMSAAGLNPHLVYGNGNANIASASAPDYKRNPTSQAKPPIHLPQFNFDLLGSIQQLQQIRNLEETNKNIASQTSYTNQLTSNASMDHALKVIAEKSGRFDYSLKSELRKNSVDLAEANLNKALADITSQRASSHRNFHQGEVYKHQNLLRESGIEPSDSLFSRMLSKALSSVGLTLQGGMNWLSNEGRNAFTPQGKTTWYKAKNGSYYRSDRDLGY